MNGYRPLASPHAHAPLTVPRVMGTVLLALLPATLFGLYQFGWPALNLLLVTVVAGLLTEALCLRLAGRPLRPALTDGSIILTGVILALTLPPWAPWWIGAIGGAFAALVGKQVFGGIGQNLFNPAMTGRVALLIAFPLEMTTWVEPRPLFSEAAPGFVEGLAITFGGGIASFGAIDAITSATVLDQLRTELGQGGSVAVALAGHQTATGLFGTQAGSFGETSALLLLAGGLYLLARRIITWHIPVALLGSVALFAGLLHLFEPSSHAGPLFHLLSGGVILTAFFVATDPVGAPTSAAGKLLFGAGCGLLIVIIRTWGGYPEGAAFAVLLMNAATPVIDHYVRPRIYGRGRRGQPLSSGDDQRGGGP